MCSRSLSQRSLSSLVISTSCTLDGRYVVYPLVPWSLFFHRLCCRLRVLACHSGEPLSLCSRDTSLRTRIHRCLYGLAGVPGDSCISVVSRFSFFALQLPPAPFPALQGFVSWTVSSGVSSWELSVLRSRVLGTKSVLSDGSGCAYTRTRAGC